MRYLPIHVDVCDQRCVIVGGGEVAARKFALLKRAGAQVVVVAPALCATLATQAEAGGLTWQAMAFVPNCLDGARLVIAATNDPAVNRSVAAAATARGVLVNVVDDPAHCSFIVPALVDRSPMVLSVSSSGAAPVLATRIRRRLEASLPPAVGELARFMGDQRGVVKAALPDGASRRAFWTDFLDSHIPALLETDRAAAETAFHALLAGSAPAQPRVEHLALASLEPLDLTLRALALLGQAERIVHAPAVPAAILEYARRDATFIEIDPQSLQGMDDGPGMTLHVTLARDADER